MLGDWQDLHYGRIATVLVTEYPQGENGATVPGAEHGGIERVMGIGFEGVFETVGDVGWRKCRRGNTPFTRKGLDEPIIDRSTDLIWCHCCSGKLEGFSSFYYISTDKFGLL